MGPELTRRVGFDSGMAFQNNGMVFQVHGIDDLQERESTQAMESSPAEEPRTESPKPDTYLNRMVRASKLDVSLYREVKSDPGAMMQAMGVGTLIVTNAAGGLNPDFQAGDLMLIDDHINLIGMAGHHPLRGPHDPDLGPRFPGMLGLYDPELRAIARGAASISGFELREGVYICVAGPSYETPADVRFLRLIGADAVGMSSVPEVIVARHSGMRVLGVSCISNMAVAEPPALEEEDQSSLHEEVLEVSQIVAPRLSAVVRGVLLGLD